LRGVYHNTIKYLINLSIVTLIQREDAKWKIKENEWYLYGFDTLKIFVNSG
jgi:hypothetical protein